MLKEEVTFTNYDDETETKTLWFNLSKGDAVDNFELIPRLEAISAKLEGHPDNEPVPTETMREILDLVKEIIRISYGERDGEYFDKSPEVFKRFQMTAAYDEFVWSLFNPADRAFAFVSSILPKEIRSAANEQAMSDHPQLFAQYGDQAVEGTVQDDIPAWELEGRDPTVEEFKTMTKDQMQKAFAKKISQ